MPQGFPRRRAAALLGGIAILGALAAGCADSSDTADQKTTTGPATSGTEDRDDMGDMTMNDPDATPASEISGSAESSLTLLDTRPPGTDGVTGTAWLALGERAPGTTVTVQMSGLEPGTEFVGHLHAKACAKDNGGPHFKFDSAGGDMPPNEVHIGFTAADDGTGGATITNEKPADEAKSLVIHPAEATDNRLACADF